MDAQSPIDLARKIVNRHHILSLQPLIDSCRSFQRGNSLNVAVFGRFKAGKSSFLNTILGMELLPVGVVPVTAIITEIGFGPKERAVVHYLDGTTAESSLKDIGDYIDETRNPANVRKVKSVQVELPTLARFRGIEFVDTPGLESILAHNTEASRDWLPNVGLALVAIAVDPPLSQKDLELIRDLYRYTPNVSILLTKVDTLDEHQRNEVYQYIRSQLDRYLDEPIPILPYSIRPSFESLRADFERMLVNDVSGRAGQYKEAVLTRKTRTLLNECADYLGIALKAAKAAESDRQRIKNQIIGQRSAVDDLRLSLHLAVKHAAANTRTRNEKILLRYERELSASLLEDFDKRFPQWMRSLRHAMEMFEEWLQVATSEKIMTLSSHHRNDFIKHTNEVGRQLSQLLQGFRNRISEAALATLGVPLRTTEFVFEIESPQSPDIRIGKIFDRNWELLSAIVPMALVKGVLRNHFRQRISAVVFKNLSRLAFQWEEIVNSALNQMEREALSRLESLVSTLDHLLSSAPRESVAIDEDLMQLNDALASIHAQ